MTKCQRCNNENIIGVEYSWDNPEHYDGISEWMCSQCQTRVGRWSGKVLANNEIERKYGGEPVKNLNKSYKL